MKNQKKFTYKVSGLKGSVVYTDFLPEVEVVILGEKISAATDNLRQYFADNFLQCDKIILTKIEI